MVLRSKRTWRTSLLLLGIIILSVYLLFFDTSQMSEKDFVVDIEAIEKEIENSHRVDFVTYKPPKADGFEEEVNEVIKETSHTSKLDGETEYLRTLKYHKVWAYADKAINIHELFADTPDVETVLEAMATAKIVNVDVMDIHSVGEHESGTAEKWVVMLEGGQKVMMKLMWEEKGRQKKNGLCNFGYEIPTSEIAAFHLHRILGFRNTPYVTGRVIDLEKDILPAATPAVARQIIIQGNRTCVTGKCYFCKKPLTLCPPGGKIEASLSYWVPRRLKLYTYPPKYMPFSTPRHKEWENIGFNNRSYCNQVRKEHPYDVDRYYHDLFDFAVIDTLMFHYDSKHYLIYDDSDAQGLTVRLDHGRALRRETWWSLDSFRGGHLTNRLKQELTRDPISPIFMEEEFYVAIERRLVKIKDIVERCAQENNGWENILVG